MKDRVTQGEKLRQSKVSIGEQRVQSLRENRANEIFKLISDPEVLEKTKKRSALRPKESSNVLNNQALKNKFSGISVGKLK